ncbi:MULTISPECIES: sensor histidine kinase [Brevibacillus]|uniref:sensor histidine kinase n=1 Tax=Brevibacillus TaxID=55080 RepID=UPI000D0F5C38|nr:MULTISPECIES: sensor histidine kinase [Brevibacillus]MED1948264.1 GHKL domain-containing protein [Brevibacillus formosus]MED1998005.1 GHKL domain-containing protein [Brevibacillus formosus]MED2080546.1 GHKL domain-containing protein [Brevibacillus formosus]PSK13737.1 ATP-binding protein [Brevibacillus sp. NRRL NRS-603]
MIQNNFPIVFCIILLMGLQVNFFFNSVLDNSAKKQNRFIYFIIFGVLDYLYLVIPASLILSSMLSFLVIFSFAQSYTVEFKTKFTFSMLYCVLVSLSYFISLYLFYSLDSVDFSFNPINEQDQIANTKAILLGSMIMFAIIQIIRLLAKRRSFSLDNRYYVLFLVIPVVSIYQLSILTYKDVYSFISVIGFLLLNVIIFYIFDNIVDKFQFMHENSQLQHQMDYQDANYEKTVHSFKSIKRIIHDTNQQLLYIEECIKRNELEAAMEHIKTTLNKVEGAYHRVNTGNLAIDALVTNTLNIGQANGIRIDTKINLYSQEVNIDRYDLCVALGNMLDNAIEASKRVKIAEDRYILIKIYSTESTLLIHILNHMENEFAYLRSQKPNAEFHGIGLTNIARICDKYGGHMTIETKHKEFNNMVLLPY